MLHGKNAIVTGSTSGIGLGIATALAHAGANVMMNGFGDAKEIEADRVRLEKDHGVKVLYSPADMMDRHEISGMVAAAREAFGSVDILVNNAGIQHVAPIEAFPPEKWDAIIAINLSSAFHGMRVVIPDMKQRRFGRIINIASAHALVASPFKSAYVAAKHGIAGLTKTVALEVAEHGITVNAIAPGYVLTPLVEAQIPDTAKARGNMPVVGRDVFTHTAGIHADGESKGKLYTTRLHARRFGRKQRYALGKLAGKASLDQNLRALGIRLQPENRNLVLQRIVELGDKKHAVTAADLPLIIADVLKTPADQLVAIESYDIRSSSREFPRAEVRVSFHGKHIDASATGDGGYDAFVKALAKAARKLGLRVPQLIDYKVRIAPGGRSGALVETVITWRTTSRSAPFTTLGVDSDQIAAAVIATEKMLNLVASQSPPKS